jgi:hypothetical protein
VITQQHKIAREHKVTQKSTIDENYTIRLCEQIVRIESVSHHVNDRLGPV